LINLLVIYDTYINIYIYIKINNKIKLQLEDLKLSGLTVSEQISIIDVTLACLVSWLEGHSLAQTVFTNLYFQKPYEIEVAPLKGFCICIYKIIEAIRDFANRLVKWVFNL